ncbi:MAG: hypothetical protein ACLR43_12975 [Faecalibacillus faecis]
MICLPSLFKKYVRYKICRTQFTLRLYKTLEDIKDLAYECIASGATYPTLYNDEVNIPAVGLQ